MPKETSHLIGSLCDRPVRISVEDGSGRWQLKNLFALVTLPEFERGETEEDVAKISEVSPARGS